MGDLVVSGVLALLVLYAGIALVVYAILRLLWLVAEAVLSGNYLVFGELMTFIADVVLGYIIVGLWLRRTGTI